MKNSETLLAIVKEKLVSQQGYWAGIDQKNSIILAIYGVVLAIIGGLGFDCNVKIAIRPVVGIVTLVWLFITALGIVCSLTSIWPRNFKNIGNLNKLIEKYSDIDEDQAKEKLVYTYQTIIDKNDKIIKLKNKYLDLSLKYFLPLSIGCSVIAIFLNIVSYLIRGLNGG